MSGYSRAGIAAEAGVTAREVTQAVRRGELDDSAPYQVVSWILEQRGPVLEQLAGVTARELKATRKVLAALGSLSASRATS